jgi:cytochrome c oxidase subunit 2
MKRGWIVVLAALTITALMAACGSGEGAAPDNAAVKRGQQLFTTGGSSGIPCATCHTLDGSPLVGPSLQGLGARAGERIDGVSAEEYLHMAIVSPSSYLVDGFSDLMPKTFGEALSPDEIDSLVAFMLTLK